MRWIGVVALVVACGGGGSFLGTELDKQVGWVDERFRAGDVDGGCRELLALMPDLSEWMQSMRGNRVGPAWQALHQMEEIALSCSLPQRLGDETSRWKTAHGQLRGAARHTSGWGTVLWWGLIAGAGFAVAIFLRRLRS